MKIPFNNLQKQWKVVRSNCEERIQQLHEESSYILGPEVSTFENNFARYIGRNYAVGVSSGLDALKIALRCMEYKGTVTCFVPAHTFVATALSVKLAFDKVKIILVDCDEYFQISIKDLEIKLSENKRNKNKVIVPVDLYGHTVDSESVKSLAKQYNCDVIEDASQAHGSQFYNGNLAGTLGKCSAFSLYPGKNLGAAGDAGIVVTDDEKLYSRMLHLRNYGSTIKYQHDSFGYNNRLDSIQAIILDEKLKHLYDWNMSRSAIAEIYLKNIEHEEITLPTQAGYCGFHSYHIFPLLCDERDNLMDYLGSKGIQTGIYYPTPIELMKPFRYLDAKNLRARECADKVLGIPIHPFMTEEEALYVSTIINSF